jgi:hypothetical protein
VLSTVLAYQLSREHSNVLKYGYWWEGCKTTSTQNQIHGSKARKLQAKFYSLSFIILPSIKHSQTKPVPFPNSQITNHTPLHARPQQFLKSPSRPIASQSRFWLPLTSLDGSPSADSPRCISRIVTTGCSVFLGIGLASP